MVCTLMHKRLAVAEIELDEATGFILKVHTVFAPEHLPVGVLPANGVIDRTVPRIPVERDVVCKPFKKHHIEQLKLVSSFDWIDFDVLSDVGDLIHEILSDKQALDFVCADRAEAIARAAVKRIDFLQEMALSHSPVNAVDSIEDDVTENLAEDYTLKMTM